MSHHTGTLLALVAVGGSVLLAAPPRLDAAAGNASRSADPVLEAARELRTRGCDGRPGIRTPPLVRDRALDDVARRWASQGGSQRLDVAFESAGVRTRQSASLALTHARPADIAPALRQRLCAELTGAEWTQLGWSETSNGIWIVVAVPSQPPARSEASASSATALRLANALRARGARCGRDAFGPAPPLVLDPHLTRAAQVQADEMAAYRFLAHEGRDGSTPAVRVTKTGYAWRLVGENVAAGPESAEEVMSGWEQSPDHCRNLLDPQFTAMGLAFATNPRSTGHSTWWSLVLARPKR